MKAKQQRHTGGGAVKEKKKEDDEERVTVLGLEAEPQRDCLTETGPTKISDIDSVTLACDDTTNSKPVVMR
ncbi:hypothetical protein EYF80_038373 [Liparis tanakae]|uniref:Uncharacterized protein n=1 Tax=Liparis tanakae TaxID=230148 RepID=A0A4Z2GDP9_9TELE|nr:hypothetical protein EYF80_038373 [Liparis tanakae]